jgi:hypothetical protein
LPLIKQAYISALHENMKVLFGGKNKALLSSVILFFTFLGSAQAQVLYEGQVIDKTTQSGIPFVNVGLIKAKLVAQTNQQGYFKIDAQDTVQNDTLIFSSVGYQTLRLPISNYLGNTLIELLPTNVSLEQVDITNRKLKVKRLNAFDLGKIRKDRVQTPRPYTAQYTHAKLFDAPEENVLLTKIELGRTVFDNPTYPLMPLVKSNPKTRFQIHIMSVNPTLNTPDKVLFTKEVSLNDNAVWVTIDVSKEEIVLDKKQFFIAVQWLRIPYNEVIKLEWAPKVRALRKNGKQVHEDISQYRTLYQPALVKYAAEQPSPSFVKDPRGNWILYRGNEEIALSATVQY